VTSPITLTTAPGPPPGPLPGPAVQRLTPIEELDYLLDRPWEPNLVLWETHTHGHLDRAILAEAVSAALGADSGARRRLAATPRWGRRLYWRPAPARAGADGDLLTVATWHTPGELDALRERLFAWPICLDDAVVRVVLAVGPGHDAVIMQVHHTAFDGISSLRLLGAIARAYRERLSSTRHLHPVPDPPPSHKEPKETPAPSATEDPPSAPRLVTRAQTRAWPGTVTRIAPQAGQPDRPGYGFVLISDIVTRPAPRGDGLRPTVNDLLVAALCLAIDRWNAAHGRVSGQISVTIPVNGRAAGQRWQGDGNLSWLIRVVTTPAQRAAPDALIASVAAQTRAAKERGRTGGTDALSRLLATGWAPVLVKRCVARLIRGLAAPMLTDTSLVSNLGVLPDPPSFDGRGTEPLWLAPPCPMPRGLSVGAVTVAGRLHLSVRYRLVLLDHAAAEDFTACLRAALTELAPPPEKDDRAPS
jgi:NRPS condensation-like uncharacterized protein